MTEEVKEQAEPDPQPICTAWSRRLAEAVNAEKAHRTAEAEGQQEPVSLGQEPVAPDPPA
ncbi:hypothetical protein [Streptomyces sp. NPDC127108]|uniref:hypothetical protein n=1 Tax=Streptomyces sp. NPDC127108 TaxID=3345361 RepID=UPI003631EE25